MALHPTMAHLSTASPRYADWLKVFGTNAVQVMSPLPSMIELPNKTIELAYVVELTSLAPPVLAKLTRFLADRFGLDEDELNREIGQHGVPILAKDITLSVGRDRELLRYFT